MAAAGCLFVAAPAWAGDAASGLRLARADADLFSPVPAADAADWSPAAPVPSDDLLFDTDWSLVTTGAFIHDNLDGDRYQVTLAPTFTIDRPTRGLDLNATANGLLSKTGNGNLALEQLNLRGTSTYDVDEAGTLTSDLGFSLNQQDPNAPDVADDVAVTPVELSGTADSMFKQKFGRLDLELKGNVARSVYGATTLTDGTSIDNTDQNNTQFGGELRLGYALTPVIEAFGDAQVLRTGFDAPSDSLGVKLDGTQYALTAGLAAAWGDTLNASVSAGVGVEHFDDPDLAEIAATLYDADITYKPTEALTLTGDLSSAIAPPGPNGSGTAQVTYQATAGATYLINEWLDARASANWHNTSFAGTDDRDDGYGFGLGADYLINRHTKLSADYSFGRDTVTPNPAEDTQTISLGLTVQK